MEYRNPMMVRRFDFEYATEWRRERDWLAERGFTPTFVKLLPGNVERYKYRKTPKLFEALAAFYREVEAERSWKAVERTMGASEPMMKVNLKDLVKMGHVTFSANDLRELLDDYSSESYKQEGTPFEPEAEDDTI